MSRPSISVIIPAYNAEATIGACVSALHRQQWPESFEIIVIDDGSTDRTADLARLSGARVISTPRARPAAARNVGIRAASGAIICCTDADCTPHPDWLQQITKPFDDDDVAACKGTYQTRQPELVAHFVQLEYEDKYDLLRRQESIDFIDTYSAAYRRDVLTASGGFDERFDYLEDQELSFRLAARGHRMLFCESAVVEHLHSATLRAYLRKKFLIGYWKAQVVRRFPERLKGDSHTPQVMKAQMALAALTLAAAIMGAIALVIHPAGLNTSSATALIPAFLTGLIFLATTWPFLRKAWRKDKAVAFASPLLLFGRAAALGAGYAWGLINPRAEIDAI